MSNNKKAHQARHMMQDKYKLSWIITTSLRVVTLLY